MIVMHVRNRKYTSLYKHAFAVAAKYANLFGMRIEIRCQDWSRFIKCKSQKLAASSSPQPDA